MIKHFGVNIRQKPDGMKLTRDNYIKVSNKSSFFPSEVYDDSYITKHTEHCYLNFDLNMKYFSSLFKEEFNKEFGAFLKKTKVFKEIDDLLPLSGVSGYYILVLDEYCSAYIGTSGDIKKRIQSHWSKQKEFDRLIFCGIENSILSIDSFRAFDTTRIFVYPTYDVFGVEDNYINLFSKKYLLNRTAGGLLDGGLGEAIVNRKTSCGRLIYPMDLLYPSMGKRQKPF